MRTVIFFCIILSSVINLAVGQDNSPVVKQTETTDQDRKKDKDREISPDPTEKTVVDNNRTTTEEKGKETIIKEKTTPVTPKEIKDDASKQIETGTKEDKTNTSDPVIDITGQKTPEVIVYIPQDDIKNTIKSTDDAPNMSLISPWVSYGLFTPVSEYSSRYYNSYTVSAGVGLPVFSKWGFSPEAYTRFMHLSSKSGTQYSDNSLDLAQFSAGFTYSHELLVSSLIGFITKPLSLSVGISEGITRVMFQADNMKTIEYINTVEIKAGVSYPLVWQVDLGITAGYRAMFTAGTPLQGYYMQLVCGVRI